MKNKLWNKHQQIVIEFLEQNNAMDKKLLLACSGGIDSVYLFYLLKELRLNFSIAHINYNLRGEDSLMDAKFVANLADSYKIPIHIKSLQLEQELKNGGNLQNLARIHRYTYFESLIEKERFDFVLLAHHLNDQVETIIFNLINGAGLNGLKGIKEKRQKYLRPLLSIPKEAIHQAMNEMKFTWREDYTNQKNNYKRNKIRNEIVPKLIEVNNKALERIDFTRLLMEEASTIVDSYFREWKEKHVRKQEGNYYLDSKSLLNESAPYTLLNAFLKELDVSNTYVFECEKLLYSHVGSKIETTKFTIWRYREGLYFEKNKEKQEKELFVVDKFENIKIVNINDRLSLRLEIKKNIDLKSIEILESERLEIWNADKISWPLRIRKYQEGDKMRPFGMQSFKKLSKIFKDYKIENFNKAKFWLAEDQKEILSVLFLRKSEKMRVNSNCQFIMTIEIVNKI